MTRQMHVLVETLNHCGDVHLRFAVAMFLQVSVLVVLLLVLDRFLLRRLRAAIRYSVWTLVLVKLMLPVSYSSPISLGQWLPDLRSNNISGPSAALSTSARPAMLADEREARLAPPSSALRDPAAKSTVSLERASQSSGGSATVAGSGTLTAIENEVSRIESAHSAYLHWKGQVFCVWLLSVTVLVGLLLRRAWLVRRIVANSYEAPDDLQKIFDECLQLARVPIQRVALRVSDDVSSPAICGLHRGWVLMPNRLIGKLDKSKMRHVLLHELLHWRRYDLQVNCLQTALQIAYFYNPLVWVANSVLRRLREQAVDEAVLVTLKAPPQAYSTTLLDIAASVRRPAELTLQLVGVVESRKALSDRIKRILNRPVPKLAGLGKTGVAIVIMTGLFLLPMAASHDTGAANAAQETAVDASQSDGDAELEVTASRLSEDAVLSGRLTDETGAPVTDAKIAIWASRGGGQLETNVDDDGRYRFETVPRREDYRLTIESHRWTPITYRDGQIVNLAPKTALERDFVLPRACRVRVRTVDQAGQPVRRVGVLANSFAPKGIVSPEQVYTDDEGWATVGGLPPSQVKYLVATMHDDYAFEKLVVTLNDPDQIASHEIVLRPGKSVQGTAICNDGKPPAGWRILAVPSWWHFGRYPRGTKIAADGSFTLDHIVAGEYDVTISVPSGQNGASPKAVMESAQLTELGQPLTVKMDHPSPDSLVFIRGRVEIEGHYDGDGFWVFANSVDNNIHTGMYVRKNAGASRPRHPGDNSEPLGPDEFRIGPLPPGDYRLAIDEVGTHSEPVRVTAPAKDLVLNLKVEGKPQLRGIVVNSESGSPVSAFKIRAVKSRTLSGPNYVQDAAWREFKDENGRFKFDVVGPGVYYLLVAADGFAWTRSDPINTATVLGKETTLSLSRGVSFSGTVVDEQGDMVDGATVLPLSTTMAATPHIAASPSGLDGASTTVNGQFDFAHLSPGEETFKVTHPDYCPTVVPDVRVSADSSDKPLSITLMRGGTVRGRVYDALGEPDPDVTLFFRDESGYGGTAAEEAGRLATAVTNADGTYEVRRLPEKLCYVSRRREWESLGVVRHAIFPENGRTHVLDIGGSTELSGRLLVNGVPFSRGRVLLSGTSPHFGIFKAYAKTADDGSFTFRGVAPGNRTLYYPLPGRRNKWGRIADINVTKQDTDLGLIDHVTGEVVVQIEEGVEGSSDVSIQLHEYDPIWPHGNEVGFVSKGSATEPYVIEQVPVGKFELTCYRSGQFQVRRIVELTRESLRQQITLQMPSGNASLTGRVDGKICGPGGCSALKVWSEDRRLLGHIIPKDDGSYQLDNIPSGKYVIRDKDTRNAPVLLNVSLREGEKRKLDLTQDNISVDEAPLGFLEVRIYTSAGIPIPCKAQLIGSEGTLGPHSSQHGRLVFVGAPGTYTLSAGHSGFVTIQRDVKLKPTDAEGRPAEGYSIRITLKEQA